MHCARPRWTICVYGTREMAQAHSITCSHETVCLYPYKYIAETIEIDLDRI